MLEVGISSMFPNLVHTPKACFSKKYCSFFIFNVFLSNKNVIGMFNTYLN